MPGVLHLKTSFGAPAQENIDEHRRQEICLRQEWPERDCQEKQFPDRKDKNRGKYGKEHEQNGTGQKFFRQQEKRQKKEKKRQGQRRPDDGPGAGRTADCGRSASLRPR